MPQLIRNIDDYFREKKKDLYYIQFTEGKAVYDILKKNKIDLDNPLKGEVEIKEWFARNLPDTLLEPIYPLKDDSGYLIAPWDHSFSIEFTSETLKIFTDAWENEDGGSVSSDFQCYYGPYKGQEKL